MTENEMKVAAYKAAIVALVKTFQDYYDWDKFISAVVILAKDYDLAQFGVKNEKQEANNELGEQQ